MLDFPTGEPCLACSIFGVDDILIGLAVSAAIGGGASYFGGQATNKANQKSANSAMAFEASQAAQNRDFQAQSVLDAQRFDAQMAEDARYYNTAEADRQMAFQDRTLREGRQWAEAMSGTAYQRAMGDMRAAGLNPVLGYVQGGAQSPGASGASGAMGTSPAPTSPVASGAMGHGSSTTFQNALGAGVSSALQAANTVNSVQQGFANTDNIKANTQLVGEQAKLAQLQQGQVAANTAESQARTITEGYRSGLVQRQTASEAMVPPLTAARTAEAQANVPLIQGQSITETERAIHERERGRGEALRNNQYQNYGPPTRIGDFLGSAEAIARRGYQGGSDLWRSILENLR